MSRELLAFEEEIKMPYITRVEPMGRQERRNFKRWLLDGADGEAWLMALARRVD